MSSKKFSNADWIIELNVRPNQMSPISPPFKNENPNNSRLFSSIYALTLGESLVSHQMDSYLLEHIQLEKECSEQDDLQLIWSDDVSLTLCFLASLAHHGEYSQEHLLQRYFQWWMNGYLCPTGLCFSPHVHVKKMIDSVGESQASKALEIEIDLTKKTSTLLAPPSSLLLLSPIAYFYNEHSSSKREEIIKDCIQRMFGKQTSTDVFIEYIELLVKALNGISKERILQTIQLKRNPKDLINETFFRLIDFLSNDKNDFEEGLLSTLKEMNSGRKECRYLNPYDSDRTILLTLYLQISTAIYNSIPSKLLEHLYAQETLDGLIQWIIYQKTLNLHSISQ